MKTTLSRRTALAGGVSAIALAGIPVAAPAEEYEIRIHPAGLKFLGGKPDTPVPVADPHPAWLERRETKAAEECRRNGDLEARHGPDHAWPARLTAAWNRRARAWDEEYDRLTGLLIDTPAHTPEGIATKAYLLWAEGYIGSTGQGDKIACALIGDLLRGASRPLTPFEAGGFAKARAVFGDKTPVQEYRALTDQVVRIAGRLDELKPQLSGTWIRKIGGVS